MKFITKFLLFHFQWLGLLAAIVCELLLWLHITESREYQAHNILKYFYVFYRTDIAASLTYWSEKRKRRRKATKMGKIDWMSPPNELNTIMNARILIK